MEDNMIAEHTPGPWKWDGESMIETVHPNLRGDHEHICDFRTVMFERSTNDANANLIAAAPDLLEVCRKFIKILSIKRFENALKDPADRRLFEAYLAAGTAIDKAEGKS